MNTYTYLYRQLERKVYIYRHTTTRVCVHEHPRVRLCHAAMYELRGCTSVPPLQAKWAILPPLAQAETARDAASYRPRRRKADPRALASTSPSIPEYCPETPRPSDPFRAPVPPAHVSAYLASISSLFVLSAHVFLSSYVTLMIMRICVITNSCDLSSCLRTKLLFPSASHVRIFIDSFIFLLHSIRLNNFIISTHI